MPDVGDPKIQIFDHLLLGKQDCFVDGDLENVCMGNWAFYLPRSEAKILHSIAGMQHCIHETAHRHTNPTFFQSVENRIRATLGRGFGPYSMDDWTVALSKPAHQRAAENWVAAKMLAQAGLGPRPKAVVAVKSFQPYYASQQMAPTFGFVQENAFDLPTKSDSSLEDMKRAGVQPDRIRSCLRQQINGYITDLNSVVGVMPIGNDELVSRLSQKLYEAVSETTQRSL